MRSFTLTPLLLGVAAATPYRISDYIRAATNTPAGNSSTTVEPCAEVANIQATSETGNIPADIALECLRSVPLDVTGGKLQLQGIAAFLQFQSTLAYLKDPPPGYLYPPVDILGSLDEIGAQLQNNFYTNEYDFQLDILLLVQSAYDGHFTYQADITDVFQFVRDEQLYSLSSNGLALPDVYAAADVSALVFPNTANYTASPVTKINNQNVETFLNDVATLSGNAQDPDANYNAVFPNVPLNSQSLAATNTTGSVGDFFLATTYQGTDTILSFGNGSTHHIPTYAVTQQNFTGITDGKSFFERFCTGPPNQPAPNNTSPTFTEAPFSAVPTETTLPAAPAYPDPLVIASDYSIGGYLPKANKNLAVLSIPSFEPANPIEFQDVIRELLATAKADGRKKLIIDLRGNGGGFVDLAYDLFKQLFPGMTPYGATNFRAFPLFNDVGEIVSEFYSNVTDNNATAADFSNDFQTSFNLREDLTQTNADFPSWSAFFGPVEHHGDNFTNLMRYNLSDIYDTSDIPISGYNNLTNIVPSRTFAPEDVLLVQDGGCASTCTVFSEFMKSQAKVQQLVFGGRKQVGPMQGVGNVKGGEIYMFTDLYSIIGEAWFDDATPAQQSFLNQTYPTLPAAAAQAINRAAQGSDGVLASVNVRNQIREGDQTFTPLQFVYEAADCRLFYTPPQILDQSLVWTAAYNAFWGNGSCVSNSTGQPSSLSGAPELAAPPTGANNTFGANVTSPFPTDLSSLSAAASTTASASSASQPTSSQVAAARPTTNSADAVGLRSMAPVAFLIVFTAMIFL